jgi:hypothetical protein
MNEDMKVILRIGGTRLVLDTEPAIQILKLLWAQHIQELHQEYKKDDAGNYGYVYRIAPFEPEKMALEYISPTNYLAYTLNGDTK